MKNNQNKLLEYYRSCPQQYSPEALSQCKKTPASLSIELSRVSVCTYWLSHSPPKSLCTAQFNSQIKTSSCLITYFPVLTWISIVLVRTSLKVSRVWKLVNIIKQSASVNKRGLLLAISAPSHTHTHTHFFFPLSRLMHFRMHVGRRLMSRSNSITVSLILFKPIQNQLR